MTREDWIPIDQLEDRYEDGLLIAAPELVDLDFNIRGVSRGYYSDVRSDGTEGWVGTGWDACNDEPTNRICNPTHFIRLVGPYTEEEAVAHRETIRNGGVS